MFRDPRCQDLVPGHGEYCTQSTLCVTLCVYHACTDTSRFYDPWGGDGLTCPLRPAVQAKQK